MLVKILVLSSDVGGYEEMTQAVRETWAKHPPSGCDVTYYYAKREGTPPLTEGTARRDGDVIECGLPDGWYSVLPKTLMAFELLLGEGPFDFLFRCCSGSYVSLLLLLGFLEGKPATGFYSGIRGWSPPTGTEFASGSGYFLSRDLVTELVRGCPRVTTPHPPTWDDVVVGKFLLERGVLLDRGARRADGTPPKPPVGHYHYHIGKRPDYMRTLHRTLNP